MSRIGSVGLDSTLPLFHAWVTKFCHKVLVPPSNIDNPVLHQEASLQKICALEKNQAANKLIVSSGIPTTSALLPYHCYY